jgi:hypothetical protein
MYTFLFFTKRLACHFKEQSLKKTLYFAQTYRIIDHGDQPGIPNLGNYNILEPLFEINIHILFSGSQSKYLKQYSQ